jgi:hypothetical protein
MLWPRRSKALIDPAHQPFAHRRELPVFGLLSTIPFLTPVPTTTPTLFFVAFQVLGAGAQSGAACGIAI